MEGGGINKRKRKWKLCLTGRGQITSVGERYIKWIIKPILTIWAWNKKTLQTGNVHCHKIAMETKDSPWDCQDGSLANWAFSVPRHFSNKFSHRCFDCIADSHLDDHQGKGHDSGWLNGFSSVPEEWSPHWLQTISAHTERSCPSGRASVAAKHYNKNGRCQTWRQKKQYLSDWELTENE